MSFNFTDAWILQSIYCSEIREHGAELVDIIAYADYSNHAILTYSELTNSLVKLLHAGLVVQLGDNFQTSMTYKAWWTEKSKDKKRIYLLKAIEETEKYLNKNFQNLDISHDNSIIPISESDFKNSVDLYINKAEKIFKDKL